MLSIAAFAASFPVFSRWCYAGPQAVGPTADKIRPAHYRPEFFDLNEYTVIERLADLIIPSDDSPGASEAGVAEFIDFMSAHDDGLQKPMRSGVAWINDRSLSLYGKSFLAVAALQRTDLLDHLAYPDRFRSGEEEGRAFFQLIRKYTVMGYYTTRIGLEQLDCPSLKMYSHSPECTHPEHRNAS